jgi:SAM-dependent methyltransferase
VADAYALTAEFYDLLAGAYWTDKPAALAAALEGAQPEAGPVLDIGAGTGLATLALAEALPTATIQAIEPSPSLRAVLHSRLAARPDLHHRVTVLPTDLQGAELPDRLGGAVAISMIGHLSPAERVELWRQLAQRLTPGAPAIIEVQLPARPEVVPQTEFARARLGDLEYVGFGRAEPSGPTSVRWTMTYRVVRDGRTVDERINEFPEWHTVSADDITAEAAASGLTCAPAGAGLLVLRATRG